MRPRHYITAYNLARCAHEGQFDKTGEPYFGHPYQVSIIAGRYFPDDDVDFWIARSTGLLHDVVEDTETTLDDLRVAGMPRQVIEAVKVLTRRPGEDRKYYLERIIEGPRIPLAVKIADMTHNMDPDRIYAVARVDVRMARRLERKYRNEYPMLLSEWDRRKVGADV